MSIEEIRELFVEAVKDEAKAKALLGKLKEVKDESAQNMAYFAATTALQAKFMSNPLLQLPKLQSANKLFAEAEKMESGNLEVHFLRFSTQSKIPSFLSLGKDMESDKTIILKHLLSEEVEKYPKDFIQFAIEFMLKSEVVDAAEQEQLRSISI